MSEQRSSSAKAERAAIVQWLREQATTRSWGFIRPTPEAKIAEQIADAIERGEHHAPEPTDSAGLMHDSVHKNEEGARPAKSAKVAPPLTGAQLEEKHGFEPVPEYRRDPFVRPMRIMVDGFAPEGQTPNNRPAYVCVQCMAVISENAPCPHCFEPERFAKLDLSTARPHGADCDCSACLPPTY